MKYKKIAIVGSPNVGKSSIFNNLTGRYATVSNYPGTTVEIFSAKVHLKGGNFEIIDTPGMNAILPLSEEERIARQILIADNPDVIIHIGEAKNLERTLPLTLQLKEAGLPLILVLNIMDEAHKEGIQIDTKKLEDILGIPVVPTVSVRNKGIKELRERITNFSPHPSSPGVIPRLRRDKLSGEDKGEGRAITEYPSVIEEGIHKIAACLDNVYTLSKKSISVLFLEGDDDMEKLLAAKENEETIKKIENIRTEINQNLSQPIEYVINLAVKEKAKEIASAVIKQKKTTGRSLSRILGDWTLMPIFAAPLLVFFLYFGIYKLVGEFGAGTVVNFLEGIFEKNINPFFVYLFQKFIPIEFINSLFVGEYGIITLGVRYAVAIVLPIVGIFFFVFSFAEDTGYLPRMGAMVDRLCKKIGLSGRAVIPIVLGLGCDTMATMVTRILPTKRERIIATFLLSLSVPCSAQLGVIMAVLAQRRWAMFLWFIVISSVFTTSGILLNRLLKGNGPSFYIELPPLRLPRLSNIFVKTFSRLSWYFKEVLPLFIWASVIIWLGQVTGIFQILIKLLEFPVRWVGLPLSLAKIFLFGFFRRDYGAAGLYDLNKQGLLNPRELIVTAVILTLFLPCIAQFLMNIKERGVRMAMSITVFILIFSFTVGFILNKILLFAGM